MKISILTENCPGTFTPAEHGLSYLIEYDGKRILFDTGQSDLFVRNASQMKLSLDKLDAVVLSHGHYDHGNGLGYIPGNRLICHPDCFLKRYSRKDGRYIGLNLTRTEIEKLFILETYREPHHLSGKIVFSGEIPRLSEFESKETSFVLGDGTPDFVPDDAALFIVLDDCLFIISGCSHSGIVNMIEYARKITSVSKVAGVIGGFHLSEDNTQTRKTIEYLANLDVKHLFPSHCTGLPALSAFYTRFGTRQVRAGDILTF